MSFLTLPAHIRGRIYDYCFELQGTCEYVYVWRGSRCQETIYFTPISHLLVTCRTTRAELAPRWFASGIIVRWNDEGNPERLRKFPPRCLVSLTNLTIHMNQGSCVEGATCCRDNTPRDPPHPGENHDNPLDGSHPEWDSALREWQITIQYLAAHAQSHLQLHLICDVANLETAKAIIQPLYSFPRLAVCDLRLAEKPYSSEIQDLASMVANQLVDPQWSPTTSTRFHPFPRLPPELQVKILTYTDLLAPVREVSWTPQVGFFLRYAISGCWDVEGARGGETDACQRNHPDFHPTCRFRHCVLRHGPPNRRFRRGCYCRVHHAAFSTKCGCWARPTPLFLVSRAFAQMARQVFFSRNRFIIMQPEQPPVDVNSPPRNYLDTLLSFFQRAVPADMHHLVRGVDLIIPSEELEPAYYPETALGPLSPPFNMPMPMPSLTLRVYLKQYYTHSPDPAAAQKVADSYAPILRPLADLGPKRLFIFIGYDRDYYYDGISVRDIEQRLERAILGPTYNSEDCGKERQVQNQWALGWDICQNPWPYV